MGSLSSYMSGARYRINKKRSNEIRSASFVCDNEKIKYFFQYYIKNFCENQIMLDIDRGLHFHWHKWAYNGSGMSLGFGNPAEKVWGWKVWRKIAYGVSLDAVRGRPNGHAPANYVNYAKPYSQADFQPRTFVCVPRGTLPTSLHNVFTRLCKLKKQNKKGNIRSLWLFANVFEHCNFFLFNSVNYFIVN